jgi:hypothetical protein
VRIVLSRSAAVCADRSGTEERVSTACLCLHSQLVVCTCNALKLQFALALRTVLITKRVSTLNKSSDARLVPGKAAGEPAGTFRSLRV